MYSVISDGYTMSTRLGIVHCIYLFMVSTKRVLRQYADRVMNYKSRDGGKQKNQVWTKQTPPLCRG